MQTKLYPILFINLFFFSAGFCKSQDSVKYIYADGNNNTFIIKKTELKFDPITPIESSSGIYSGGKPKTVILTEAEYNKIISCINKAVEDKSMHIDQRVMMSGMIIIEGKGGKQKYILGARSQSKAEIELLLKELMDKDQQ